MSSDKPEVRRRVWEALRREGVARFPGVEGRIPNFVGAEAAAARLADTDVWRSADVIKANPDSPQFPARKLALAAGKTLYMAVPKLASSEPFWRLDPAALTVSPHAAASIKGASRNGTPVRLDEMERIDLIVCGSVAVDRTGARVGKGGGYSDLEFAVAVEAGLVGEWTTIATTVHPVQVLESGAIPITAHDFPLDVIVTPDETIVTGTDLPRPDGILLGHLDDEKRAAIPILRSR